MINFGFKYDQETKKYHTKTFYWIQIDLQLKSGVFFCIKNIQYKFLENVHQLQNLYSALTGEQLTIKKQ